MMKNCYVGVDVSQRRGCAFVAIDEAGRWLGGRISEPGDALVVVKELVGERRPIVGIDSPRMPLTAPRRWKPGRSGWQPNAEGCVGRHAEVVVRALGLANPQWTPMRENAPVWMRIGFELFELLGPHAIVHEVFPSASKKQLAESSEPEMIDIDLRSFCLHGADMLDALIGAVTVRAFTEGRGCAVGNGDCLGSIVLPRPCRVSAYERFPLGAGS